LRFKYAITTKTEHAGKVNYTEEFRLQVKVTI
jgi:hypothetical protein